MITFFFTLLTFTFVIATNKHTLCDLDKLTFYPSDMVCKGSYCDHAPYRIEATNVHCDLYTNYEPVWQYKTFFKEDGYSVVNPHVDCATIGFYHKYLKTPITCQVSYEVQPEASFWSKLLFDLVLLIVITGSFLWVIGLIWVCGCAYQTINLFAPSFYNYRSSTSSSQRPRQNSTVTRVTEVPHYKETPKVVVKKDGMYENPMFTSSQQTKYVKNSKEKSKMNDKSKVITSNNNVQINSKPVVTKVVEHPKPKPKPHAILRQRKEYASKVKKVIEHESNQSTKPKVILKQD